MIAAWLMLAASWSFTVWIEVPPSPQALAAAAASADEVVVNGVRLRRATLLVRTDRKTGVAGCTIKRRQGGSDLDTPLCGAAIACNVPPIKPKPLEACLSGKIAAIVQARYPDRTIGQTIPRDQIR